MTNWELNWLKNTNESELIAAKIRSNNKSIFAYICIVNTIFTNISLGVVNKILQPFSFEQPFGGREKQHFTFIFIYF